MNRTFVARHFINGNETLEAFVEGLDKLDTAEEISRNNDYGFDFGIKLTVDGKKIDPEILEKTEEAIRKVKPHHWFLRDPIDRGPGTSFKQVVLAPTFSGELVVLGDLDAYAPDSEEALGRISELTDKVEKDSLLFGMGSRDKKVVLAKHERNSAYREVHELFHSSVIGSDKLRVEGEAPEGISPGYKELGESTAGLWVINQSHANYSKLVAALAKYKDLPGFGPEYFASIYGSTLGSRGRGYVSIKENLFSGVGSEEDELASIKRMIFSVTKGLDKTEIAESMYEALLDRKNSNLISQFYDETIVEEVRQIMLNALEE